MSDIPLPLDVKIKTANVTSGIGRMQTNQIVLEISNLSDQNVGFSGFGGHGDLSLSFSIGKGEQDLIGSVEESVNLKIAAPEDWKDKAYKKVSSRAVWTFRLPRSVFKAGESKILSLSSFESCTAPGRACVKIRLDVSGYDPFEKTLTVEKKAPSFELLYFEANPLYIATDKDRRNFALRWNVVNAGIVQLYKDNILLETFTAGMDGFESGRDYSYSQDTPDLAVTVYKLVAIDRVDATLRREALVIVSVLQPGWYPLSGFARYGSPAVLFGGNPEILYGIFLKGGKARLHASEYPYVKWDLVNEAVPEGMETSPGVYFANRLWLVGGSRFDPGYCSRKVSAYDIDKGEWQPQPDAPGPERMGHACVVFGGKLWMMGGNDGNGNELNDAHSMDFDGKWESFPADSDGRWDGRCMFAATVFKEKIWLYGGCAKPSSDLRGDLWTSADGQHWQPYRDSKGKDLIPRIAEDRPYLPLSCALLEMNGKLNLVGAFREQGSVEPLRFVLDESQETWLKNTVTRHWDMQHQNTHSLSAIPFGGLVYLFSLEIEEAGQSRTRLVLYVP